MNCEEPFEEVCASDALGPRCLVSSTQLMCQPLWLPVGSRCLHSFTAAPILLRSSAPTHAMAGASARQGSVGATGVGNLGLPLCLASARRAGKQQGHQSTMQPPNVVCMCRLAWHRLRSPGCQCR